MTAPKTHAWLLLIHHLPPEPNYLRVKIRRRLQKIGAAAVKNSVYVLPKSEDALEDFRWTLEEIQRGGGDGMVCTADFVEGLSNAEVGGLFQTASNDAYNEIAERAISVLDSTGNATRGNASTKSNLDRLRRRFAEVAETDYCAAPRRKHAEQALQRLEDKIMVKTKSKPESKSRKTSRAAYANRVWVTRSNIFVDRIACAWLIKRFIDSKARIKFVDPERYTHREGDLRFDMFEGEFGHRGDLCSFEVLCTEFQLRDKGLKDLAEIIHDIDLKDEKFRRDEAAGVALALRGIRASHSGDAKRLAAGIEFFDAVYHELQQRSNARARK